MPPRFRDRYSPPSRSQANWMVLRNQTEATVTRECCAQQSSTPDLFAKRRPKAVWWRAADWGAQDKPSALASRIVVGAPARPTTSVSALRLCAESPAFRCIRGLALQLRQSSGLLHH